MAQKLPGHLPSSCQEVPVNGEPVHFENDLCEGSIVLMLRPPSLGPGESWRYEEYFRGKSRRTEIQVQLRFKKTPGSNAWIRASPKPLRKVLLNRATSAVCKFILSGLRRFTGQSVDYSFGDETESPHISVPLSSVLSVHATPSGELAPRLGSLDMLLQKTTQAQITEAWRNVLPFDTDHVYTFTFYSMYLDIQQWQLTNLFGIPSIGLDKFWDQASMLQWQAYAEAPEGSVVFLDFRFGPSGGLLDHSACHGRGIDLRKASLEDDIDNDSITKKKSVPIELRQKIITDERPGFEVARDSSCCGVSLAELLQVFWASSGPSRSQKLKSTNPRCRPQAIGFADGNAEKQTPAKKQSSGVKLGTKKGSLVVQPSKSHQSTVLYLMAVVALGSFACTYLSGCFVELEAHGVL